jgi:hypothetical protein
MFRKLHLLFHTVRYLKPIQVYYQLLYKFKAPLLRYIRYNKYQDTRPVKFTGNYTDLVMYEGKLSAPLHFSFLNLHKDFDERVDWNFMAHGKLWNYNLQYFDYLHDPSVSHALKQQLLDDFSGKLLAHSIKPEPYPVSLRLINWLLYYSETGYSSAPFIKAIQYQSDYLQCNLEYHILANHLMENLVALSIASIAFQDDRLLASVSLKLKKELQEQILPDGGHYEGSPMYHSIILSKLLMLYGICQETNRNELLPVLHTTIGKMIGWLQTFSFRNGTYAHFNDSAEKIAVAPATLYTYAKAYSVTTTEVGLQESGYRKFTNGSYEVIVDVAPIQPIYQPGHAHADMLHFCVQYKDELVLADTSTSTYNAGTTRNFERSTSAHNTVVINEADQSDTWSAFRVGRRARVEVLKEGNDHLVGQCTMPDNVVHKRTFLFEANGIVIEDEVNANTTASALFHFDHTQHGITLKSNKMVGNENIVITFDSPDDIFVLKYQQAIEFNRTKVATVVKVDFTSVLKTKIHFY